METAIGKGGCVSLFKKCSRDLLFYADLGVSRQGGSNDALISHVRLHVPQTTHLILSWLWLTSRVPLMCGQMYSKFPRASQGQLEHVPREKETRNYQSTPVPRCGIGRRER